MTARRRRRAAALAASLAFSLAAAACSGDGTEKVEGGSTADPAAEGSALDLAGACPDPVVIQTDWHPESEYGALYELVGSNYEVDTDGLRVSGPLVAGGKDTGVDVEIRAGGPAIGFEQVPAQMYLDKSITLGQVNTDSSVQFSADQPTTSVVAPLEISPWILMWSPEEHPEFNTVVDIGQSDTKVLYFEGNTYMEFLIGSGVLRREQVDGSFTGSPDQFIASGGTIVVQNFATDAPFSWVEEVEQWGRPLKYQLIHDMGYPIYSQSLAIRAGEKAELAPCLAKLVPIIQQASADYIERPEETNQLIVDVVAKYDAGWVYSPAHAEFTARRLKELGLVGNGTNQTIGDFDMERVRTVVEIVKPIFAGQEKPIKDGLTPEDVATNEFIDPNIGL